MKPVAPVEIDGSIGEGGGQIVRSALALSMVTGKPVCLKKIRAGRKKPGLLRQHLTAVHAAAEIGSAAVQGAALGSLELSFAPGRVRGGSYRFSVGTAGSTTLVLQAVLPALLVADPSEIVLEGGTHNPFAPPFDFLDRVFLPVLRRMGPDVRAELRRPGFYPAGGGSFRVTVEPVPRLGRIDLLERGEITARRAVATVSNLSPKIADRELATVAKGLSWSSDCLKAEQVQGAIGPGNVLTVEIVSENVTELFTGFGQRGVPAERVAGGVVQEVREYLASGAPVGPYLADQLLLPFAMAGGGIYRAVRPTRHTLTNIEIVRLFLEVDIAVRKEDHAVCTIEIEGRVSEGPGHEG
ncbi:MAG: RNA 3'-terminal phosphate cyclase [Acidobacteriota bacterium]|nr:RNA 3'-terminal phosphate cyclase [Acidobacteriota bacterium]